MKIAVLGAHGQLGRDLCPRLSGDVLPLSRADLDLEKPETIAAYFEAHRPDVFVNCSAYNFVDQAETDPDAAFRVNAWGVRALAEVCRDAGVYLVHFSTDYVFGLDTNHRTPLTENDAPGPVSIYGLSKLAGEYLVRSICPQHLVIRTCGLYGVWGSGGKGGNFVETMLRVAGQGKPLRVVNDQFCTPTYTVDLADITAQLIARSEQGLFHVTNAGSCTWYELADAIFRWSNISADLSPITSEQFNAKARRPTYSVLANLKLAEHDITPARAWQEGLAAYLTERATKSSG